MSLLSTDQLLSAFCVEICVIIIASGFISTENMKGCVPWLQCFVFVLTRYHILMRKTMFLGYCVLAQLLVFDSSTRNHLTLHLIEQSVLRTWIMIIYLIATNNSQ